MKKRHLRFLSCLALFALGVSSCSLAPSGGGGDDDLEKKQRDIYQLAVSSGYEGSYEEWLDSIRGENGSIILFGEGAPSSNIGKTGDGYLDTSTWDVYFRDTNGWQKVGNIMGREGQPGKDGDTPYIGNNGNWWIGETDTGVKAEGSQGEPGNTPYIGQNGNWWIGNQDTGVKAQGEQGKPGEDGKTPYIGQNGNWWIGETDTGIKAEGTQGNPGQTPYIGENGNWWIGNKDTGVKAQGEQGDPGVSVVSIVKTGSNENVDTYTITYSDGNTSTFTVTNGVDGVSIKGDPGKDGHTPDIKINSDGYWEIDGVSTGILARGPQGEQGEPGQTAWSNTILPSEHGYVTVNCGSALVGERVNFYAYPDTGYELTAIYLNNVNYIEDYIPDANMLSVAMVEHGYVVRAIFSPIVCTLSLLDYAGETILTREYGYMEYVMRGDLIDLDDSRLKKPSDDEYDYTLVGFLLNGEFDMPLNFGFTATKYMTVEPQYQAIEKVDIKTKYGVDHDGTLLDPFNNEDAIKVAKAISLDPKSSDASRTFYIKGVLDRFYNAPGNNSNGKVSFFLTPSLEGGEQFEVYGARSKTGEFYTFENLYPGVEVIASGQLVMYETQAETDYAYIEQINYLVPAPEMHESSVTISQAITVASALKDGDTTYDIYNVTGYVVKMSTNRYGGKIIYLSDDINDKENVYKIEPYPGVDEKMIIQYFQYGAKVTIKDHIRNHHGESCLNSYFIDASMITLLEHGTDWPGIPTGITFYDMDDKPVTYIEMERGQTVQIKYVLAGNEPSEDYLSFQSRVTGVRISEFHDGVLTLTNTGSSEDYGYVYASNTLGTIIGELSVQTIAPYVAPESISLNPEVNTLVGAGDTFYASPAIITVSPRGATVKGYTLSSSDETVAVISEGTSNKQVSFIAEGDVDITITETGSGVYTVVTFHVLGLDEGIMGFLDGVASELSSLEFYKDYNAKAYRISTSATESASMLAAYNTIREKYSYSSECVMYQNPSSEFRQIILSSLITVDGVNYAVMYSELNLASEGLTTTQFMFAVYALTSKGGQLVPIGSPTYTVGSTFELMPFTNDYSPIPFFLSMSSSNANVATVDTTNNSNRITIVGAGECTVSCYLVDGTILNFTFYVTGSGEEGPDLTDAILVDYSGNDYFSFAVVVEGLGEDCEIYLLPSRQLYITGVDTYIPLCSAGGNAYYLPTGSKDYMRTYFTLDENGVMGEIDFKPSGIKIDYTNSIGIPLTFEPFDINSTDDLSMVMKIHLGGSYDVDFYVGYEQIAQDTYEVALPFGLFTITLVNGEYKVTESSLSGGESSGGSSKPESIIIDYSECDYFNLYFNGHGESPTLYFDVTDGSFYLDSGNLSAEVFSYPIYLFTGRNGVSFYAQLDFENQKLVDLDFNDKGLPIGEYAPEGANYKFRVTVAADIVRVETIDLETGDIIRVIYVPRFYSEEYNSDAFYISAGLFGIEVNDGSVVVTPLNARV